MERGARNGNSGIACFQRLHLNLSIQCRLLLYMNMYVVISLIIIVLPGMQIYVDKFIVTVYHICVCVCCLNDIICFWHPIYPVDTVLGVWELDLSLGIAFLTPFDYFLAIQVHSHTNILAYIHMYIVYIERAQALSI